MIHSFDVFDTAILRDVFKPSDIFDFVESVIGHDFAEKRIKAARAAALTNPYYTIREVYAHLPGFEPDIELKAEMDSCYANPVILARYNPETDVFISDMYLSADFIAAMLEKCGYQSPRVVVSCEEGAWKGNGELFRIAASRYGKIGLHVDDNYGCIAGARSVGIPTEYYRKPVTDCPEIEPRTRKVLSETPANGSPAYRFGYYLAPLVYESTRWALSFGRRVHFVSRDGWIPYKIAREIFGATNCDYCYLSRSALTIPAIDTGKPMLDDINEIPRTFMIYSEKDFSNEPELYERARAERAEVLRYLEPFSLQNGDIFFDVGYTGNEIFFLERITGKKYAAKFIQSSINDIGIDREQFLTKYVISNFFCVLETLFCSPEGSVTGYKNGGPVLEIMTVHEGKQFAAIRAGVMDCAKVLHERNIYTPPADLELLLQDFLYKPKRESINFLNGVTFKDLLEHDKRSIVNYNAAEIMLGNLLPIYSRSLWPVAFKVLLDEQFPELSNFLKPRINTAFLSDDSVRVFFYRLCESVEPFSFYGSGTLLTDIMKQWPDLKPLRVVDRNADALRGRVPWTVITPKMYEKSAGGEPLYVCVLHDTDNLVESLIKLGFNAKKIK